jgi:hypothetical protein
MIGYALAVNRVGGAVDRASSGRSDDIVIVDLPALGERTGDRRGPTAGPVGNCSPRSPSARCRTD